MPLLTDGRTTDEPDCRGEADRLAQSNTPLIAAGVGVQYNEELLLNLANQLLHQLLVSLLASG